MKPKGHPLNRLKNQGAPQDTTNILHKPNSAIINNPNYILPHNEDDEDDNTFATSRITDDEGQEAGVGRNNRTCPGSPQRQGTGTSPRVPDTTKGTHPPKSTTPRSEKSTRTTFMIH